MVVRTEGFEGIMKKIVFSLIIGALFLGHGTRLHAQILNGSFSTGDFTDWTVVGGSSGGPQVITPSTTLPPGVIAPTPPAGTTTQALVQSTDSDGSYTMSAPVGSITSPGSIDAALNTTLPSTTNSNPLYDTGTFAPDNGQAIYQTFTVSSAATLTFAYSYQTNDGYPYDSVGYVLDGVYTQLVTTPPYPQAPNPAPNPDPTTYVFVAPLTLSAGQHTLGFVAYNTDGPSDSTSLYVTDITTAAVPEPSAWVLLVFCCAGFGFIRKLRGGVSAI
jgi:hypothetical protein